MDCTANAFDGTKAHIRRLTGLAFRAEAPELPPLLDLGFLMCDKEGGLNIESQSCGPVLSVGSSLTGPVAPPWAHLANPDRSLAQITNL